jgi:predicted nucleic acid-binding protein
VNPPSVLLDRSFLDAVADPGHTHHAEAVDSYRRLIDEFAAERCLLLARNDHLRQLARRELFAAVDKVYVARQHRNAAAMVADRSNIDVDEAITLVLIHRYKIRRVMTFNRYSVDLPERITLSLLAPEGA